MRSLLATLAFLALLSSPVLATESTYVADPPHSSATFTVTHLGISHVSGVMPIKIATVVVPDGSNIPSSASASFDPSAIDTRNSSCDADLRSPHFFDVATYPSLDFKSTKVAATDATHFTMGGDLTMHGQTHLVTLDCQFLGRMTDGRGHTRAAYSGKATIDRTQWGMTYGPIVAGNSVDLDIEIEGIKQ